MRQIEAIPTYYDGIEYASRLEARWAVFFKEANLEFKYEPEGEGTLPDFWFFESPCVFSSLEVKGVYPNRRYLDLLISRKVHYLAVGGFFKGRRPRLISLSQGRVIPQDFETLFIDISLRVKPAFTAACKYRFDLV